MKLSRSCRFGKDDAGNTLTPQQVLEEHLCDKFAWEMKSNTRYQQLLLSKKELTFKKKL